MTIQAKVVEAVANEQVEAITASGLVALNFSAVWSDVCTHSNEVFAELAAKFQPPITFIKIEAEDFPEIAEKYEISAVPSFVLLQNGSIVDRVEGANAPELTTKVTKLSKRLVTPATPTVTTISTTVAATTSAADRLAYLGASSPVLAIIRGLPDEARDEDSKKLVETLRKEKIEFKSVNVLADITLLEVIKEEQIPCLYVNGSLFGSLSAIRDGTLDLSSLPRARPLEDRLRDLVNRSPVMVFLKGSPDQPRCGFTKQLVAILKDQKVKYDHFDILQDDEVRQGLKTFSNWPTYPQVYVKGELIGGLDIVREMVNAGDFESIIPK